LSVEEIEDEAPDRCRGSSIGGLGEDSKRKGAQSRKEEKSTPNVPNNDRRKVSILPRDPHRAPHITTHGAIACRSGSARQ
jgi:hypothetical protein